MARPSARLAVPYNQPYIASVLEILVLTGLSWWSVLLGLGGEGGGGIWTTRSIANGVCWKKWLAKKRRKTEGERISSRLADRRVRSKEVRRNAV
jgi:hypothetical protein